MKNNTHRLKSLLQQAIRECPQDFTLSEARFHLNAALTKVEQVERKREKRHVAEQEQYRQQWPVGNTGLNVRETLQYIDTMIADEQKKIQEIAERRNRQQRPDEEGGTEDSALLG